MHLDINQPIFHDGIELEVLAQGDARTAGGRRGSIGSYYTIKRIDNEEIVLFSRESSVPSFYGSVSIWPEKENLGWPESFDAKVIYNAPEHIEPPLSPLPDIEIPFEDLGLF